MIYSPCSSCGGQFEKPLTTKVRNGKIYQSRSRKCIYCLREDRREEYERIRLIPERYNNLLRCNKAWTERNKSKMKLYYKEYEINNANKIRRRKHEYYLQNKKKILARNKIWKDKNRKPKNKGNDNHIWRTYENDRIERAINARNKSLIVC